MNTFKLAEPTTENNKIVIMDMISNFSEFLAACNYKLGYVEQLPGSDTNYIINIINVNESFPVQVIVGKKYMRMMDKRLNPAVTSQFTYNKDLNLDKYKKNIISIMDSIRRFDGINDRMIAIIAELSKMDSSEGYGEMEKKYCIDEITVLGKDVLFTKRTPDTVTVRMTNLSGKFAFKVLYPENEVFAILDNFLPENNLEPKMNGINGRIAEHNRIAGEIIQKLIHNEHTDKTCGCVHEQIKQ